MENLEQFGGEVVIGNDDAFGVDVRVEFTQDLQTGLRCRGANKIDDDLITHQRSRTPIMADE